MIRRKGERGKGRRENAFLLGSAFFLGSSESVAVAVAVPAAASAKC